VFHGVPSNNQITIVDPPRRGKNAYPISTYTYAIVPRGAPQGALLQQFIGYALSKGGQSLGPRLGFAPLPKTFWKRSLFTKPRDREVVCHASAWTMDFKEDLRIKMCAEVTGEDLLTVHHEEGHLYYDRAYNSLPLLYQTGANDGFHEAIGDAIALSVTPEYLKRVTTSHPEAIVYALAQPADVNVGEIVVRSAAQP